MDAMRATSYELPSRVSVKQSNVASTSNGWAAVSPAALQTASADVQPHPVGASATSKVTAMATEGALERSMSAGAAELAVAVGKRTVLCGETTSPAALGEQPRSQTSATAISSSSSQKKGAMSNISAAESATLYEKSRERHYRRREVSPRHESSPSSEQHGDSSR